MDQNCQCIMALYNFAGLNLENKNQSIGFYFAENIAKKY